METVFKARKIEPDQSGVKGAHGHPELDSLARNLNEDHCSALSVLAELEGKKKQAIDQIIAERRLLDRKVNMMKVQRRRLRRTLPLMTWLKTLR